MDGPMMADGEFDGHYTIVYSPDDGGYWVSLWWEADGGQSPVFDTEDQARAWAAHMGGTTEH